MNVYLDLPHFYEYSTLRRWGYPHTGNKGVETPDGKYFCAIISILESSMGVSQGFFALFEKGSPHKLIFELTRRAVFAELPTFSSDGKILIRLMLKHRFSDAPISSYIVIDPEKRGFALIPYRDGKGRTFHCDKVEHIKGEKYRTLPGGVKFDLNKLTYYPLDRIDDFTEVDIPRFRLGAVEPIPSFPKRQPSIIGYLGWQHKRHPSVTATDLLKQCYQAAYGAEHLLTDREAARLYLEREFESTPAGDIVLCEYISDDVCRVNIAAWKHRGLPVGDLFDLFSASAYPRENGRELLEGFLREAEEYIDAQEMTEITKKPDESLSFKRINEFCEDGAGIIEEYRRSGMPAIHHSEAYRAAEHPAYRIVDAKLLREYFERKC